MAKRIRKNFRLSPSTVAKLKALSLALDCDQTFVIAMGIDELYEVYRWRDDLEINIDEYLGEYAEQPERAP